MLRGEAAVRQFACRVDSSLPFGCCGRPGYDWSLSELRRLYEQGESTLVALHFIRSRVQTAIPKKSVKLPARH